MICISNLLYSRGFLIRITSQLSYRTNIFSSTIFTITLPFSVITIIRDILIISSYTTVSSIGSWLRSMSSCISFTETVHFWWRTAFSFSICTISIRSRISLFIYTYGFYTSRNCNRRSPFTYL